MCRITKFTRIWVRISSAHCDQKTVDLIKTVVEGLLAKFRELTMVFVK